MTVDEDFPWVSGDRRSELAGTWGADWPVHLRAYLDTAWPDWQWSTPDLLAGWLDEAMPSLLGADSRDLAWVSETQGHRLDALWEIRGDWRTWLPAELDAHWAEWPHATPEQLTGWLDGLIPRFAVPGVADVRELGWVTEAQGRLLDGLAPAHGDWRRWLPESLDAQWPGWIEASPEHLAGWVDELIPHLTAPATEVPRDHADVVAASLQEAFDLTPGAEQLSRAEVEAIVAEVLAEIGA